MLNGINDAARGMVPVSSTPRSRHMLAPVTGYYAATFLRADQDSMDKDDASDDACPPASSMVLFVRNLTPSAKLCRSALSEVRGTPTFVDLRANQGLL